MNLKLQVRATQSLKLCYASCHAKLFDKAKTRHQNRLDSVGTLCLKVVHKAKNKVSGCGAAGSALPWGNYDRKVNSWPLRPPWNLTNDMGTNESAHLEIISQSGIPNGEIIAATQSASICYAPCYAIAPMNALGVHFTIQNLVRIAQTVWQKMTLWPLLTAGRDHKFKFWHALG